MASLRVVIFFGSSDYTGACKMGHQLALSFRAMGHDVLCVCGERPQGGALCVIDKLVDDGFAVNEERGFTSPLNIFLVRRIVSLVRRHQIELLISMVQLDAKIAGLVACLTKVPCIFSAQNVTGFYGPKLVRWAKFHAYTFIVRRSGKLIVCPSVRVADHYHSCHRVPQEKLRVISNGIAVSQYSATGAGTSLGVKTSGDGYRLLNIGRLDPQKGQMVLFEALEKVSSSFPNIKLWLVGEATVSSAPARAYAEKIHRMASDGHAGRVTLLGWRDDIPELLHSADIYVHSALWEGLPLAVLEAMACARPVIYTDCAGALDGFEDGVHGLLVKAGNVDALASAIFRMCSLSDEQRMAMGAAARKLVEQNYDISVLGKRFVAACVSSLTAGDNATNPN
jgi:glycosyltransferase involved in cell wall biosynthesis